MAVEERSPRAIDMREFPAYAVAQTHRLLRHHLDDALREIDLTTPQWGTLKCIAENSDISGADLARLHNLTPQTMNTILHNLEHADLIKREHHLTHGTLLVIRLTDMGRQRLEEAMERVLSVQEHMLRDLDRHDRSTLVTLLDRCISALVDDDGDPGCYEED